MDQGTVGILALATSTVTGVCSYWGAKLRYKSIADQTLEARIDTALSRIDELNKRLLELSQEAGEWEAKYRETLVKLQTSERSNRFLREERDKHKKPEA